jgi:glycosyltransferase involved in cell wall biosynthesis
VLSRYGTLPSTRGADVMRILHVSSVHKCDDVRIFGKLARSAASVGHEVEVMATGTRRERRTIDGVTLVSFRPPRSRMLRIAFFAPWLAWNARSYPADLLHFHDPELIPWFLLLRLAGRRIVMDVHEDLPAEVLEKSWLPRLLRPIVAAVSGACVEFGARVFHGTVTASAELAERFGARDHPGKTVSARNFPVLPPSAAQADGTKGRRHFRKLLFLGGVTHARVADVIVRSLAFLKDHDVELLVGGNHHDPKLLRTLQARPEWERVRFLGAVSRSRVDELMQESVLSINVFADYPNHHDIRSNRLFEAMGAGLPVIVSAFPRWIEFVETHGCGIAVDPNDPAAVAGAIREILEHPDHGAQMGAAGRFLVEGTLSWVREYPAVDLLYAQIFVTAGVPR